MPMEFLLDLAKGPLPRKVDNPEEIDKLRVLAAARLLTVALSEVEATIQKAEVLAISSQGRAALRRAYPQHNFDF